LYYRCRSSVYCWCGTLLLFWKLFGRVDVSHYSVFSCRNSLLLPLCGFPSFVLNCCSTIFGGCVVPSELVTGFLWLRSLLHCSLVMVRVFFFWLLYGGSYWLSCVACSGVRPVSVCRSWYYVISSWVSFGSCIASYCRCRTRFLFVGDLWRRLKLSWSVVFQFCCAALLFRKLSSLWLCFCRSVGYHFVLLGKYRIFLMYLTWELFVWCVVLSCILL
jgi:hypothetical protein